MIETTTIPKRCRRETGNVFVLIILMLVPLAALAGSAISLGSRESNEHNAQRGRALALINAESGLDLALAQVIADPDDFAEIQVAETEGDGVRAFVEFEELGDDDIDNDGDGAVDETDESKMVRITSTGCVNVDDVDGEGNPVAQGGVEPYVKRVRAIGTKAGDLPSFPFAVYLGDPLAEIDMNGNAFFIDGNDYTASLAAGPGSTVPGIATTGTTNHIKSQLSNQQFDNVKGEGTDPSIKTVTSINLQDIIDSYKNSADIKFVNATSPYTGELGDYDTGDLKITHVMGNLKISGGSTGAGLLLVEGNLEITGGWEYRGVVVVTGQVIFRGGGGGKRVVGTCLVGGDVFEGGGEDLEVSGTVDILYSSTIQSEVGDAVGSYTLTGWQEL